MTLLEMSVRYQDSAAAIRQRISELRLAVRLAEDPDTAHALQRRITELTPLLQETRELAVLCERYYDRGYRRNVKYTV